jgi:uncharacterized membrane protein YccC
MMTTVSYLLRLRPPPPNLRVAALRSAASLGVPLLVLWSLDRLDLGLYATFGAFAGVYGGTARFRARWRVQVRAGAVLVGAVVLGVLIALSPHRGWLAIPVVAVWAAISSQLSDRLAWRPPGPMFPVFALAACSAVPAGSGRIGPAVLTALGSGVWAVGLAAAEVLGLGADSPAGPPPEAEHPRNRQIIQAARCAGAVLIAGVIASLAGIGHPYWAMVAAVVPLAAHTYTSQITRGLHRVLGTAAGIGVAALLLSLHLPALLIVLVAMLLQGTAELFVVRHYGLALVAITPLALLLVQVADPQPVGALVGDRLLETCVGVAVGLLAVMITRERSRAGEGPAQSRT